MTFHAIFSLFTSFICFTLACFVFFKNTTNHLNRIFAILCISFSYWSFAEFQFRQAESLSRALLWIDLSSIWTLTIAFLFHFVLFFTQNLSKKLFRILLICSYMLAVFFLFSNIFFVDFVPVKQSWGWSFEYPSSVLYSFSKLWSLIVSGLSLGFLILFYLKTPDKETRHQTEHILIGISIVFLSAILSEGLLPLFSVSIPELTTTSFTFMSLFVGYAIWRHHLFTLDPGMAADTVIRTISDALAVVNMERKIEIVNKALLNMIGYSEKELLGKSIDLFMGSFKDQNSTLTTLLNRGSLSDIETTFIRKDTTLLPVSLSWSLLKFRNKIKGIVFVARDMSERNRIKSALQKAKDELERRVDERTVELKESNDKLLHEISERKLAEQKLATEKETLSITLKSITDGVITTDLDGKIVLINKAAEELTGYPAISSLGKDISEVYHVLNCSNKKPYENTVFHELLHNHSYSLFGRRSLLLSKTGDELVISECGFQIKDAQNTVNGYVFVFRDITEKNNREEEIFTARKLESISLLARGIAHDFNNLLTGIVTNLFMAKMDLQINTETYQLVSAAEKAAFRATTLTKQLLTFSNADSSVIQETSIKELIESSVGFYLRDSKSEYRLEFEEKLMKVKIDRGQIDQVLNNIIINADQSMPSGGVIKICAENILVDDDMLLPLQSGLYVRISISDQGQGIPSEHMQRIFDPYFTTRNDCVGLGLTTAYAIVQKHGGHISVTSQLNFGTTFTIYLPASNENPEKKTHDHIQPSPAGKGKIILVDDEEIVLRSAEKVLTHLGFEVYTCTDGKEAFTLYKEAFIAEEPFLAVILDLTIPNGTGAAEIITEFLAFDQNAKILVSSGYVNDPVMVDHTSYGFCSAIFKPYDIEDLKNKLHQIMNSEKSISDL